MSKPTADEDFVTSLAKAMKPIRSREGRSSTAPDALDVAEVLAEAGWMVYRVDRTPTRQQCLVRAAETLSTQEPGSSGIARSWMDLARMLDAPRGLPWYLQYLASMEGGTREDA